MKNSNIRQISDIMPKGRNSLAAAASKMPDQAEETQKIGQWFDGVFREICLSCSGWRASLPNADWARDAKKVWIKAFAESGLTDEKNIRKGIDHLRQNGQKFLPSPHEFIQLCTSSSMADYGMPDLETAYREALKNAPKRRLGETVEWSHEAVRVAAGRSSMELCEGTEQRAKSTFTREYKHAFELVKAGKLAGDKKAMTKDRPDPNFTYYQRLLKNHGPAIASDFLKGCAKNGVVIQENGNVTYEDKSKAAPTSAASILESLGVVKTQAGECQAGDMPEYLIQGTKVDAGKKQASLILEALEREAIS